MFGLPCSSTTSAHAREWIIGRGKLTATCTRTGSFFRGKRWERETRSLTMPMRCRSGCADPENLRDNGGASRWRGAWLITDRRSRCHGLSVPVRSDAHTSELPSLMRNSYAVFCLTHNKKRYHTSIQHRVY